MSVPAVTRTDLLLLGMLLDRPMHGYELYQRVKAEGIDDWFRISMAVVYYSLDKLRELGLVAGSPEGSGRGSARKAIHRLTEAGRGAFFGAMETDGASREKTYLDYDLVVCFLNRLPRAQAIPLLEQRHASLAQQLREVQLALEAEQSGDRCRQRLAMLDHKHRYLEMEHKWLADVIDGVQGNDRPARAGKSGELMDFGGDLRHQHLTDLMRLLASGRHSGRLSVTDGAVTCTLGFDRGQPTGASWQRRGEPPAKPTSGQILEMLSGMFRWREGRFTLDQERPCAEWCVPIDLSTEALILVGCRSVDDWAIIQHLVPSTEAVFEPGPAAQCLAALALTPAEEQIAVAADGVRSVSALAQELGWTLFAASRVLYGLAAVDVVRTASIDQVRLRRAFFEIAELLCRSTLAWRTSEDDTCEQQVNERCEHLPLRLRRGRIEDRADPQTRGEGLVHIYRQFLQVQLEEIGQQFGTEKARQSFDQTLRRLAPELQDVAKKHGLGMLPKS